MERKILWNKAAIAGLYFGAISSAYLFANYGIAHIPGCPAFVGGLLNAVLWIAKFGGCIYLMMYLMKKLVAADKDATNSDTFKFGAITSMLSAVIYSAVYFAYTAYIANDEIVDTFNQIINSPGIAIDSNTLSGMSSMMENLPQIGFWGNLVYCFLFGIILSAILSSRIPARNPFGRDKAEEL
ncbi:MAG: DUF4199 domain-containing protein [Candidatus Cryptobacteroides sp.]